MQLLFHDVMLVITDTMTAIFKLIFMPIISEFVVKPCKLLVEPVQETIDNIPIPGLNTILNLSAMVEEVIDQMQVGVITTILEDAKDEAEGGIAATSAELGIASLDI